MGKSPVKAFLMIPLLSMFVLITIHTKVFAQTTGILVKDTDGKLYQYSYQDLKDSLMDDKILFNEFKTKKVIAYQDDKRGYVDFEYLKDVYMNTDKKNFNLNKITESAESKNIVSITEAVHKRIKGQDGTIQNGDTISPATGQNDTDLWVEDIY